MSGRIITVTELIGERGFGRFQFLVALWCGFLVVVDGFDIGTCAATARATSRGCSTS